MDGFADGGNIMSQGRALGTRTFCSRKALSWLEFSLMGKKLRVKATEVLPSLLYTIPSQEP